MLERLLKLTTNKSFAGQKCIQVQFINVEKLFLEEKIPNLVSESFRTSHKHLLEEKQPAVSKYSLSVGSVTQELSNMKCLTFVTSNPS